MPLRQRYLLCPYNQEYISSALTKHAIVMPDEIDIREDYIAQLDAELLNVILKDHSTSNADEQHNIFWATADYQHLGKGYQWKDEIKAELITGEHCKVVTPRVMKSKVAQTARSKDMAEVFTPSWICNAQNNLIDEAWFGRKDVFNQENPDHTWTDNTERITFPEGKTWKDYVGDRRLEITCGEAPYITSRYDTTTGAPICVSHRIGLLDRKLRIVGENTCQSGEWLEWAQRALKSTYAYEWQGDSLLLAREAMLFTFIDFYVAKFGKMPLAKSLRYAAYIISWNAWQMDGLKGVVPDSCGMKPSAQQSLFEEPRLEPCQGCKEGGLRHHNGTYCYIRQWNKSDSGKDKIRFIDLIKDK